jgi:hypothetical protein
MADGDHGSVRRKRDTVAMISRKLEKNHKSFMLPTDGKATNGYENKIRWSFFNPLGNFFNLKLPCHGGASGFGLYENPA